jgi:hypothetical protein
MFIKRALICAKDRKTDDELKAIMATHPWAPVRVHGFYKEFDGTWAQCAARCVGGSTYDAIWCDAGVTCFGDERWTVDGFHTPGLVLWPSKPFSEEGDDYGRRMDLLGKRWWSATVELIFHQIPDGYHVCRVYYGEIEDEYDYDGGRGGDVVVAEEAWRESLLAYFDYSPKVKAVLGIVETA